MSLISDALKRTQQNAASGGPLPSRPPTAVPRATGNLRMANVTTPAPRSTVARVPRYLHLILLLGALLLLGAGGFGYWWLRTITATPPRADVVAVPAPVPVSAPSPAAITPAVTAPLEKLAASISSPLPTPSSSSKEVAPPPKEEPKPEPKPTVAAPLPPRPLPRLQLQGVTVHAGVREALINGQTVVVGDVIDEARVLAIEPRLVRLEFEGREFVVRLP